MLRKFIWKNTVDNWGLGSILLHWLVALGIFILFPLGLWMVDLDYYNQWYHEAPFIHKSIGSLLLLVMSFRLFWRWRNRLPHTLSNYTKFDIQASNWMHRLLYIVTFLTLITGYLISTAKGDPISVFGWFNLPATIQIGEKIADSIGQLHLILAFSLFSLVTLHALAAFKHHLIDKDITLSRMLYLNTKREP